MILLTFNIFSKCNKYARIFELLYDDLMTLSSNNRVNNNHLPKGRILSLSGVCPKRAFDSWNYCTNAKLRSYKHTVYTTYTIFASNYVSLICYIINQKLFYKSQRCIELSIIMLC